MWCFAAHQGHRRLQRLDLSVIIRAKPRRPALRLMRMKKEIRAAAGAAVAALLIAGCGSNPVPPPVVAHGVAAREPLMNPRPYGTADTGLGLDVLSAWCQAEPQANLVLSPSSLASGLGMAYLGARGGTARAMAGVLHLPAAGGQALEAGLQARSAALRHLGGPGVTLDASDQVWADPGLQTKRSYLDAVATGYDAGVAQAWLLTDALYMHAAWATPFDPNETSPGPFTTSSGQRVTAQFMTGGQYSAVRAGGWTAVWLPYRGGKLGMAALLPPAGPAGCTMPAAAALAAMTSRLTSGRPGALTRSVAFPKVNLATQVSLKPVLTRLGMGLAFSPAADFTALSPQACCIGFVAHAATLDIGEKGTVASAATAVGIEASAGRVLAPPVVFNRPYLIVVTDRATGEPLFMARVTNPTTR